MTDLKRGYVVEVCTPGTGTVEWWAIHRTDDQAEAVRVATEEHAKTKANTRVRQFWVQYGPSQTVAGIAPKGPAVPTTELHTVVCPNHAQHTARVYDVAVAVRCPECKTAMVPEEMVKAIISGGVVDLE